MSLADFRQLRRRQTDLAAQIDRQPGPPDPGTTAQVVQVYNGGAMPATAPGQYDCHPVTVTGAETEGGAVTATADSGRSLVVIVLNTVPAVGDYLVARLIGGRWVARKGGGGYVGPPMVHIDGCPCSESCVTLYMVSSNPNSNNHILQSATLVYGPTPAGLLPLAIAASSYLSTTSFTDFSTGDQFYYYLSCYIGYYVLSRVYITSLYGSPYRDATRYRWPIGYLGNSCVPFALMNGTVFSGGDPSCVVTISCTNPYG